MIQHSSPLSTSTLPFHRGKPLISYLIITKFVHYNQHLEVMVRIFYQFTPQCLDGILCLYKIFCAYHTTRRYIELALWQRRRQVERWDAYGKRHLLSMRTSENRGNSQSPARKKGEQQWQTTSSSSKFVRLPGMWSIPFVKPIKRWRIV